MNAAYVRSSGSPILACDGCLTRLVSRCRPRKTATIGIRPVLLHTWKRQRFRDRCHDRSGAQGCNVCRQRENARTAYYDRGKREKYFLRKTHLLTHCSIYLSALNAPFRRFVAVPLAGNGFGTVASATQNGFAESGNNSSRSGCSSRSRPGRLSRPLAPRKTRRDASYGAPRDPCPNMPATATISTRGKCL